MVSVRDSRRSMKSMRPSATRCACDGPAGSMAAGSPSAAGFGSVAAAEDATSAPMNAPATTIVLFTTTSASIVQRDAVDEQRLDVVHPHLCHRVRSAVHLATQPERSMSNTLTTCVRSPGLRYRHCKARYLGKSQ